MTALSARCILLGLSMFAGNACASRQGAFDPADDTFGGFLDQPDIAHVAASYDDASLIVDVKFHFPVAPPDFDLGLGLVGSLEIDTDADAQTGGVFSLDICPQPRSTGFEFFVTLFDYAPDDPSVPGVGAAPVRDVTFAGVGLAVVTFGERSVRIRVPLDVLPQSNGAVDVALALGTPGEPTDCAPDGAVLRAIDRRFADGFE